MKAIEMYGSRERKGDGEVENGKDDGQMVRIIREMGEGKKEREMGEKMEYGKMGKEIGGEEKRELGKGKKEKKMSRRREKKWERVEGGNKDR